jgi:acetyl esterase/lipase
MPRLFLALGVAIGLVAAPSITTAAAAPSVTKQTISYGPQHADVYIPAHTGTLPIAVLIHGGGWNAGGRIQMDPFALQYASTGSAVAMSVDYSLSPYPAGLDDLRVLMTWIQSNAASIGGDPSHVVLLGDSAGGNLAGLLWDQPGVRAIASWSGPMNLPLFASQPSRDATFMSNLAVYDGNGANAAAASPITYVAPGYPPTLLFNGSNEKIPLSQETTMDQALAAAGVVHQSVVLQTIKHAHQYSDFTVPGTSDLVDTYTLTWLLSH